jgi:manganese/zinc/iron transport system substrate-binding protein
VGEAVPVAERIPIEGVPGKEFDPHIWFAPGAWRHAARAVAEGLSEADPDHAETFARNLASFEREIERTEAEVQGLIATIPPRSRVLVTSHDAFSYFARAFGLEVASIQGKSTASEATTADIERVAEKVADAKLGAVFIESSVPQQTIDAVLASAKRRGQTAVEGGALYGDSMGDPESGEGSWAGALRYNAETIAAGLGSQVGDDR